MSALITMLPHLNDNSEYCYHIGRECIRGESPVYLGPHDFEPPENTMTMQNFVKSVHNVFSYVR